jgi:hypothetical protein
MNFSFIGRGVAENCRKMYVYPQAGEYRMITTNTMVCALEAFSTYCGWMRQNTP